ncbi:sugar kinase [Microbispora hainanensis]|uniref:Sugar kinase n=1 Tax=Microbispora hainanensis TaxID=568844 RepID=A0ABZ1T047_9ACTN|nr:MULTISPECIES: sugar kinase [Microbispora]NJP23210.1 sugar kinase [Microbispora sp. CL1-1]TQS16298.1 sugar kinase [Microbispora sp. SCL1-1]
MSGLLVIGDVVTDVVALHDGPAATGTDTPADIALHPGGSGANTASWAARLGADTRLLARAGYDTGEWHAAQLTKAGVRPHLRIDPERPSAVVIAMVDSTGERSMLTNRGASGHIGVGDWTPDLLDGVGHLHVSAYTMFAEPGLELVRLAMREAAGRGITISVDPASSGPLRAFGPERFLRESAPASIVIPNLEEALLLADAADPETAAGTLSAHYGTAVVKLGAGGALLARDGRIVARAAAPTAEVVDSTGAGDAFAAGFLVAFMAGDTPEEALRKGCETGAAAVAQIGARPDPGNFTLLTPIAGLRRKLHH